MECAQCETGLTAASLTRCPICHKIVCENCRRNKGGKYFCSRFCAEYFFYGDLEEDDP